MKKISVSGWYINVFRFWLSCWDVACPDLDCLVQSGEGATAIVWLQLEVIPSVVWKLTGGFCKLDARGEIPALSPMCISEQFILTVWYFVWFVYRKHNWPHMHRIQNIRLLNTGQGTMATSNAPTLGGMVGMITWNSKDSWDVVTSCMDQLMKSASLVEGCFCNKRYRVSKDYACLVCTYKEWKWRRYLAFFLLRDEENLQAGSCCAMSGDATHHVISLCGQLALPTTTIELCVSLSCNREIMLE